jgi:squalene-hopene/tetraprenyl-beta-curcumene cyclase
MNRGVPVLALVVVLGACGKDEKADVLSNKSGGGGGQVSKIQSPAGGYGYAANLGADLDRKVGDAVQKGKKWLLSRRDAATGAWGADPDPKKDLSVGFTALATTAVIGATARESVAGDPTIVKSLDHVASALRVNGSIGRNPAYVNYETSVAVGAFAAARIPKYGTVQARGRDFLIASQVQDDRKNVEYGGFPYGGEGPQKPTDLSNLQFALTALRSAGVPPTEPVFQRSLEFLARVQNRSETNPETHEGQEKPGGETLVVVSGNDGGAYYAPRGAMSQVGFAKRADGKYEAASYGSMTYALLGCLLFAGVKADDPRVVAAVGWIQNHFTVDRNPGFEAKEDAAKAGQQGYYYYLRTMARALTEFERVAGRAMQVRDRDGKGHAWRREISERLVSLQRDNGSWANDKAERWEEGNPLLATSYALETLATCQGRLP